ncbi:SDR family NAD(P)-dependent oxidoreductase [Peterkaempfera bronchialis]|uniref:SDR family NAD(P)-dependent oxidoreductase n=1 Tax=Peterkaempfera bronchialis TaxID=2126346 RepID=A0A345SRH6_9ACTN|nr:SDR family NAD(P)-dependent oxidoreductase [Peterkaempfera bronchialis]
MPSSPARRPRHSRWCPARCRRKGCRSWSPPARRRRWRRPPPGSRTTSPPRHRRTSTTSPTPPACAVAGTNTARWCWPAPHWRHPDNSPPSPPPPQLPRPPPTSPRHPGHRHTPRPAPAAPAAGATAQAAASGQVALVILPADLPSAQSPAAALADQSSALSPVDLPSAVSSASLAADQPSAAPPAAAALASVAAGATAPAAASGQVALVILPADLPSAQSPAAALADQSSALSPVDLPSAVSSASLAADQASAAPPAAAELASVAAGVTAQVDASGQVALASSPADHSPASAPADQSSAVSSASWAADQPSAAPPAAAELPYVAAGATGRVAASGRVAFVYCGNGSQWAGMGGDLLARDAVFRAAVEQVDTVLTPRLGWSVAQTLASPPDAWRLAATEVAQPLLFAVQVGLTALLRARGIEPAMVVGHSVGEVAAAHTSGALTLRQAAAVIAERSRTQGATAGSGRMAAVGLPPDQAEEVLARYHGTLELAGLNSPQDVTVAGDAAALAELGRELGGRGVYFQDLGLDYAFHSRHMDGQRSTLTAALADLDPAPVAVPLYSTVTGQRTRGTDLDADYWWQNVRRPVRFHAAVQRAVEDGAGILLEVGPHPVLRSYLRRIAATRPGHTAAVLPTLRREADGPHAVATAVAAALAAGADTDWKRYFPQPGRVTDLPGYPWQRERHWSGTPQSWVNSSGSGLLQHPLLGERLPAPVPVWEGAIEPVLVPWLADHRLSGSVVMPATGFVEMALAAGRAVLGGPVEVEHLDISNALVVPWADATAVRTQVSLNPDDGTLAVTSTDEQAEEPRPHVRARVRSLLRPRPEPLDLDALRAACPDQVAVADYYASCAAAGLGYGPAFRILHRIRAGRSAVLADYRHDAPGAPYTAHPALLDGALQAGVALLLERLLDGHAHLPAAIAAVRVWDTPAPTGVMWVRERSRTDSEVCWDITIAAHDGTVTAQLDGCRLRRVPAAHRTPVSTHRTVLRAAPHPDLPCAPSPLPSPERIAQAAQARIADLQAAWRGMRYDRFAALYKQFTAESTAAALARLLPDPTAPFTPDDLVAAGMQARHRRLIDLLAPLMERHGHLVRLPDGRWRLSEPVPAAVPPILDATAEAPAYVTELALAAHQAHHLDAVLRGAEEPLGLLSTEPAATLLEQYHDTAPPCRFHNRLAQALLEEMVRHWPADRALRILEIGAGTGGTAAALLPLLPADRTRYCFTDVSPVFFTRAQNRFGDYDFIEYRTLDLDADPAGQGYPAHSFDLVVAANSLHTAKDLEGALRRVATLLAPGGHLLGVESHDAEMLAPVFGTLGSFHGNTDTDLRPDSVLLPRDRWPALLDRCGYTGAVQTGDDTEPARSHFSAFLAATPHGPAAARPELPAPPEDTAFLIATDAPGADPLPQAVVDTLTGLGATRCRLIEAGRDPADWRAALADHGTPADQVSLVLVLGSGPPDTPGGAVTQATRHAEVLRALAVACRELPPGVRTALWLVTRPSGALPTPVEISHPGDSAAWGVARCLVNEQPELDSRRICLQRTADPAEDAERLVRELLAPGEEDEIVLTARDRFVPREQPHPTALPTRRPGPCALRVRHPGLTYRLDWEETPDLCPGPGQVVLDVRAAALNYRDIMQAVGLLPAEVLRGAREEGLGLECAGVVTACGPGVTTLKPGDRVVGMMHDSLASRAVSRAADLRRIPDHLGFIEAATAPVAFCTVHYSLLRLARLQPGETVLVHGAAGGVGLAALQYARAHRARVIATAGSDLKRDFLRSLGVEHVLDSRSLDFAVQVGEITGGEGVDIVLNSLAGEAIARGLELLRPGGRFIELGKRDMYEGKPLPLRPFGRNLAFHGVDLSTALLDLRLVGPLLQEVDQFTRLPEHHPLPHSVFPAARVEEAFRLMQHSRHLGKVVVTFDPLDEPVSVEPLPRAPRLDPQATYLVTGGTSGFGAATAVWLADLGARHLVLVSRRGSRAPEAASVVSALTERGVQATVRAADVADPAAMRAVLAEVDAGGHPLRGVVHCAMHMDDAPLAEFTPERIAAVLAPKLGGAAVLDDLTRGRELDLFLLYSSTTAMIGNFTQAPYTAANLYLEGLARQRRQRGETALAIAWGAIGETGYVVRNDLLDGLLGLGIEPLAPRHAFARAERLLAGGLPVDGLPVGGLRADRPGAVDVAGISRCTWSRTAALLPLLATARLRGLVPARPQSGELTREELLRALGRMTGEEALDYLTGQLTALLADVLYLDPEQLDPYRRLDTYGMDSLMAAQVLVALNQRYDLDIPPMEFLRSNGTVAEFARIVHLRLGFLTDTPALPHQPTRPGSANSAPPQGS